MSGAVEKPFFRADQVGSLLRPRALILARSQFNVGEIDAAALRAAEDAAIRDGVKMQEDAGLSIITDGEFRRENWWIDFVRKISGAEIREGTSQGFKARDDHDYRYVPLDVVTQGKLTHPGKIFADDFSFLKDATKHRAKITIPSPTRMHFHGGRSVVSKSAYPDIEEFFADLAALYRAEIAALELAGCRYIQIDDPLLTYFIGDSMRAAIRADGEVPEQRLARYVRLINDCVKARRADTRLGIHLCRGNSKSGWMTEGGYERIAEAAFGGLDVDSFYLEYDDERSGDFMPLRFIPKKACVVLGLVTTKFAALEKPGDLKRRIDEAARHVDPARLALSPQCGFASTVEGNLITEEVQRAKLRLVAETARDVWGTAGSA